MLVAVAAVVPWVCAALLLVGEVTRRRDADPVASFDAALKSRRPLLPRNR